jgi:arylsulfatase A-like enzyme
VRRALGAGVVLGAIAGALVGVLEAVWVIVTAGASLDGEAEIARLCAGVVGVLVGAGTLVGLAEGLIAAAVTEAAHAAGEHKRDTAIWQARLYTTLAVVPVALVCAQIFAGPRARAIAHHDIYAVAIGVVALICCWALVRAWQRLYQERMVPATGWSLAVIVAMAAYGLYRVDQQVLVRLYPFFHLGLSVLVFAGAQLAVALAHLGARRKAVRLLRPRAALAIGCVALTCGALALGLVGRTRALRAVIVERTALASPLVRAFAHPEAPAVAAGTSAPDETAALPEGPHLPGGDVVLITVDALRADRVTPRTAPFLSSLAARGVKFERAYTQVPHTSFSLATLLTGKFVFALSTLGLDAASHETLPEVLRRERYKTAAFFPPSVFTIDRERLRPMEDAHYGFEYVKYEHMDAPGRTDQVIQFYETTKPERAFVWVHYFEPHEPYDLHPGPFADAHEAVDRYDGEVRFVDDEVARLVGYLQKTRPHALVIVAADHGEEFGEHGGRYHGTTLYEEQERVPLIFAMVDGAGLVPHRVAAPVGLVDVAPTILALAGILPSAKMRGRDLGPWLLPPAQMAPAGAHGPVFAEIGQQKMIVDGNHKLICDLATDACSAFDLAADPGERRNRIDEPFAVELRHRLDGWMTAEARFETAGGEGDARTRRILERARLGDKTAAPQLVALATDATLAPELARLWAALPPEPSARATLARLALDATMPAPAREWSDVALARLGDDAARARLPARLARACADGVSGDYCARAALADGEVRWLARALERGDADEALQIELARALGRSHDPAALDPLMLQLATVRTRTETLAALAQLDDARTLPTLLMWVGAEPYVPARARMVTLVAQLGKHDAAATKATLTALGALALTEREPPVMAALLPALHGLGDHRVVDLDHHSAQAVADGELWLGGSGTGSVDVTAGSDASRVQLADGIARVSTVRGGSVRLHAVDGDARPQLVFSRRAP